MARVLVKSIAVPAYNEATTAWTLGTAGVAATQTFNGGTFKYNDGGGKAVRFNMDTVDGTDDYRILISSGGGAGPARGAYLEMHGNEFSSTPGRILWESGSAASGSAIAWQVNVGASSVIGHNINGDGASIIGPASLVSDTFHIVRGNCGIAFTNLSGSVGIGSNLNAGTARNYNRLTTTTNGAAIGFDANVTAAQNAMTFWVQPPGGSVGGTTGSVSAGSVSGAATWIFGSGAQGANVRHKFIGSTGANFHTILTVEGSTAANSLSVSAVGTGGTDYCAMIHDRSFVDSFLWFSQSNTNRFRFITTTNDTWFTSNNLAGTGTRVPTSAQAGYAEYGSIEKTGEWTISSANAKNATPSYWHLNVFDTRTQAAGVGGGIIFSGFKNAQTAGGNFAAIAGAKTNSTGNNESGTLNLYSSANGTLVLGGILNESSQWTLGTTTSNTLTVQGASNTSSVLYVVAQTGATEGHPLIQTNFVGSGVGQSLYITSQNNANGAATGFSLGRNSVTGRSINAGGTVNASGADYAEYMLKSNSSNTFEKGELCGVDANGKLTKKWSEAKDFMIKSTNPSFVGGDPWYTLEEDTTFNNEDYQAARLLIDRISFCGQVPCIVTGTFAVGDWIVPQEGSADSIEAVAISDSSITFAQYKNSIGKIWATYTDTGLGAVNANAFVAVGVK